MTNVVALQIPLYATVLGRRVLLPTPSLLPMVPVWHSVEAKQRVHLRRLLQHQSQRRLLLHVPQLAVPAQSVTGGIQ